MRYLSFLLLFLWSFGSGAQTTTKKILLQGYWWDYRHNNYPQQWANYLTELAPRLRDMGIDAVWIPPVIKNPSPMSVGYAPFDHYDLGDKRQKGQTGTKMGTKDDLLRMIAVMHANGIEVIGDVVLNHLQGAGSQANQGGQDPNSFSMASSNGFKTFRYSCWETPATAETQDNYWSRKGRWHKNYRNFHPNPANNCTTGDICEAFFGPDIDFLPTAFGPASNVVGYNPPQSSGYMRNQGRDWMMWLKKQTAFDGYRWDAVKHFPINVQEDYSWNMKYGLPDWAAGGTDMFNVGEWVGSKSALDAYVQGIQNPTGEMMMGTFDFGLRAFDNGGGLYGMVYGMGGFNMASLPGAQQEKRVHYYASSNKYVHRTVPFVNNHDTFRPQLNAQGNYIGWNTNSELSSHIEPNEPRMNTAYAIIMAVDGNPQVFFEDLFDIGYNGNRYNHDPKSSTSLPVRSDLVNLMWCHQNLNFKDGAYFVRHTGPDLLVIERGGKAVICATDSWATEQSASITTQFPAGTKLRDYSGAYGDELLTVGSGGVVTVKTKPVNPALNPAGRHGYAVWAPDGQLNSTYQPPRNPETTQEWEMADDLGDRHFQSLTQGGAIPANSLNYRVAGKIYADAGKPVKCIVYPQIASAPLWVGLYTRSGQLLASNEGAGTLVLDYTPTVTDWIAIKVRSAQLNNPSQKCWVNVTYTAPKVITDAVGTPATNTVSIFAGFNGTNSWTDLGNWEQGMIPNPASTVIIPNVQPAPVISGNYIIKNLYIEAGATLTVNEGFCLTVTDTLVNNGTIIGGCIINSDQDLVPAQTQAFGIEPNPTNGRILLTTTIDKFQHQPLYVQLAAADGRIVAHTNGLLSDINAELSTQISTQPAGLYFVRILTADATFTLPLVKQ